MISKAFLSAFVASASFQQHENGAEHQLPMPVVPAPEDLSPQPLLEPAVLAKLSPKLQRWVNRGGPFEFRHVYPRDELDPAVRGETTFVDAETAGEAPIHADAATLMRYANELEDFLASVRRTCGGLGLGWTLAPADGDVGRLFRDELCEGGFLC